MSWLKGLVLSLLVVSLVDARRTSELNCRSKRLNLREGCSLKGLNIETEAEEVNVRAEKLYKTLQIDDETVNYLPASLFQNFEDIEVLYVTNSHLKKINRATFDPVKKLEEVDFEGNDLADINVETFNDLTSLKSLNLAKNKLKRINSMTFSKNIALEFLTLSFNDIDTIHENTFAALHRLEILLISNNQIVELRGKTFKSNFALEKIDLSDNLLQFVSGDAFDHISTKLNTLNLKDNKCITTNENFLDSDGLTLNFTKLRDELFENCLPLPEVNCLKDLEKERNEKERLREGHSTELEKLNRDNDEKLFKTKVDLKKRVNQLEADFNATSELLFVETMKFEQAKDQRDKLTIKVEQCEVERDNATRGQKLALDALINNKTPSGSQLQIESTKLRREIAELRDENENIRKRCDVSDTHVYFDIICYSPQAVDTCKSHGVVVSSENMLLSNTRGSNSVDVKNLIINESFMIFIPQDIFAKFRGLAHFEVVGGNVRNLPRGTFKGAENLMHVEISQNSIQNLPRSAFEGAKNCRTLILNNNGIKSLSDNAFADLDKLTRLILRSNEIVEISANIFSNLVALKELSLKINKIEHLRAEVFSRNVHLEVVHINNNPIKTIDVSLLDNCLNLKRVYYGKTNCINEVAAADDIETFKRSVMDKCKD